ncbi:hypothetical protein P343_09860 [Sporolactobacillus laevolacticus DSM 442]|uniref:Uncharacterized protein n=1 Tax=Sporolactobacillus laevolacticus DSM 442 TaxID=1395513 RepID=V6IX92_9BACL|nr:hypothetical protein P343_09860 [Sporolactobacillus laevolacticus DSM 442]
MKPLEADRSRKASHEGFSSGAGNGWQRRHPDLFIHRNRRADMGLECFFSFQVLVTNATADLRKGDFFFAGF